MNQSRERASQRSVPTPPPAEGLHALRLGFEDRLEEDFRRYHQGVFLLRMRWALLVAMALFLLFAVLDAISLPTQVRNAILALRLGLMLPVLFLTWLATYQSNTCSRLSPLRP